MNLRTCNACGWVHFAVTREQAEVSIRKFNEFYDTLPEAGKQSYGDLSNMDHYLWCKACGEPHTNFREAQPGGCPDGCTLNPIMYDLPTPPLSPH